MSIDTEHPDYTLRKAQWEKLRDCAAGQEAIHGKGQKYLPKLSGQTDVDYKAYLGRTLFYGATARTIDGLSGMVFRKPPQVVIPEGFTNTAKNITLTGMSLQGFAEQIVDEVITVARAGILVDHPAMVPDMTVAMAEAMNIRPFLKHYSAEQIFNWKTASYKNAQVLTQVRLWEWAEYPTENEFEMETKQQIRILDLNPLGQYRQRVFIEVKMPRSGKKEWVQAGPDIIPLKSGAPLDFIPFYFVGVKNSQAEPEKPPLIDLANTNLSHFVSSADLEHGAHFTGLPTAVITGHTEDTSEGEEAAEYRIGAATAWVFPNAETNVQYLEFQGQGLEALEKRIAKKEEYMAFLGARMLAPEKKQAETAETAQIHRLGETSVLSSLSQSVSEAIEQALKFMCEWAGFSPENVEFDLNRDFTTSALSAQELTALLQLWQGGGIAYSDLLDNLKRGEIVNENRTEDDIRSEIETSNPFNNDMNAPIAGV